MIPAITMFWGGLPKWARDGILLAVLIVGGLILGKAWVEAVKDEARQKQRAKDELANAEEYARTVQTSSQVKEELHVKVDAAREAAAVLPAYPDADSLRDQNPRVAAIVFGDRPRDGG